MKLNLRKSKEKILKFKLYILMYRLQNLEIESEPIQKKKDFTKKLVCIIDNQGNPINHLDEGIKAVILNSFFIL